MGIIKTIRKTEGDNKIVGRKSKNNQSKRIGPDKEGGYWKVLK